MTCEVEAAQPISFEVSDLLNRAVRRLVLNKYLMDRNVAEHGADMLAGDLHDGGYGPAEPLPFLHRVLPFMCAAKRGKGSDYGLVPTRNTLGCSWRWRRRSLDDAKAQRLVSELTDARALENEPLWRASYALIRPLGIFAPHEGKNRVDFLREEGVEQIPAEVFYYDYPTADRLKIFSVEAGASPETWAVLDGRWVEKVDYPSWALPVMTAYGVEQSHGWPDQYPVLWDVRLALLGRPGRSPSMGNPDFGDAEVVDLESLKASSDYQDEQLSCAVIDLQHARVDVRYWLAAGLALLISSIALMVAPASWADFRVLAGIAVGASFGVAFVPCLAPIMRTSRRHVRNQPVLPLRLAPKRQRSAMAEGRAE